MKKRVENYSPTEKELLGLLPPVGRRLTTTELVQKRYGKNNMPWNARGIVLGAMKSLARKAIHNRENFRVCFTKRAGPRPIEFWLEKK